jgi:predicted MFS family arabinose efflux permease
VRPLAAYFRSLNPDLPRPVWILQAGGLANFFGNGVVLPFLLIYLHNVRGISLSLAGLIVATNAVAGLASGALGGALVDRIGPRATLAGALVIMAGAFSAFPLITEAWHAFALNALAGLGSGAFWPSQSSLLTRLTPAKRRHQAFAQQRVTMNLGFGLGGLVGGLIASAEAADTFTVLFLLDGASFLVFAAILLRLPAGHSPGRVRGERAGRYADVLRNRPFVSFLALNVLFIAVGIVPLSEFFPVYVKNEAGVSETGIGLIFLVNTLAIVLTQVPIARALEGRRRMKALALMGLIWAAVWLGVLVVGTTLTGLVATVVLAGAMIAFALGECLHGAVQGPMVVDLSDPRLLGRYMALSSISWQLAFIVGPAVGGVVLDREPLALWALAAAVSLAGAVWALRLEARLPAAARVTPIGGARPATEPPPVPAPGELGAAPAIVRRPADG